MGKVFARNRMYFANAINMPHDRIRPLIFFSLGLKDEETHLDVVIVTYSLRSLNFAMTEVTERYHGHVEQPRSQTAYVQINPSRKILNIL